MKKLLIYISLSLFYATTLLAQTIGKKYDLDFQQMETCGWDWLIGCVCTQRSFDEHISIEGRHPVTLSFIEYPSSIFKIDDGPKPCDMQFSMAKTIILPEKLNGDSCQISLRYKTQETIDMEFKVTAFDANEKILDSKIVQIRNTEWDSVTLLLPLHKTCAVSIQIQYQGTPNENQRIWLDKIKIEVKNRDISQYPYLIDSHKDSLKAVKGFDTKKIVPLSHSEDSLLLSNLKELTEKKIIGLGEFCHGSYDVEIAKFQFCKNLIKSHQCRMVLLEFPQTLCLLANLYIQDIIPEGCVGDIEKNLRTALIDYEVYLDFIEWVKKYNQQTEEKVFFLGMDETDSSNGDMRSCFKALLGEEGCKPYLRLLKQKQYQEMANRMNADKTLKNILGEKNKSYFIAVLEDMASNELTKNKYLQRDSLMAARIERAINLYLTDYQKCVYLAHSAHIAKNDFLKIVPLQKSYSTGRLLKQKYAEEYFAISFQAGEGNILDEKCIVGMIREVPLPYPPLNSFEYLALGTNINYFYYPTKYLQDKVIQLCSIARVYIGKEYYSFASPKARYDAIVFLRKSTPLRYTGLKL